MKVGTDAVLLGAWASIQSGDCVLDIGTGSGVIALMMAQRGAGQVDAIEPDQKSFDQACTNFRNAPWSESLRAYNIRLQDFAVQTSTYDIIVCNPPYFTDSLKSGHLSKDRARHDDDLNGNSLMQYGSSLLNENGKLFVVIPQDNLQAYLEAARAYHLYQSRRMDIITRKGLNSKRCLLEFGFREVVAKVDQLIIEVGGRHDYSAEYQALTRAFYLNF